MLQERYAAGRVGVRRDFLPRSMFDDLVALAKRQEVRKRVWPLDMTTTAPQIQQTSNYILERLLVPSNIGIIKRYQPDEVYISRAYNTHTDPPEYGFGKLLTLTLSGAAAMQVVDAAREESFDVTANTLVVMDPDVEHSVTPPLNNEERLVLFLGRVARR